MLELYSDSAAATEKIGVRLAQALTPGCILYLRGDLGAGKTTLARGLLHGLGHSGIVKSPTYTLVEPYQIGAWRLFHWDLYRLTDPEELEYLGLREQIDGETALLIEWPERGHGALPTADLEVTLDYADEGRVCRLAAVSAVGTPMLARL
ncbi:MAG: tRNA (adenosine(37)-N6)-threonylcarbamoyltransferase complex ATPase subunit type 1 TsaE [Candidatus Competibacter sp.]|nr:tRNA (adenosine(37)-N6)-threonylcarbamoyltransferase complex ATPase subunit type 1 TsaE [Candidatus Competibacter sp.]MDG4605520.1 tRNA (adenosine(37)-N6)-threonylcarbamoyltransferase complex ATPase subunit type 1 TsaE [Candidatus Contendobacter sp.]HRD48984.1 tRNA (adenosine(37)-N6)-threonylcarbamoyltransferase complex ATPase subunit type 1 TsaE [Candidatus Contendobacter sp.]